MFHIIQPPSSQTRLLRIALIHNRFNQRPSIKIPSPDIPIDDCKKYNQSQKRNRVVHRQRCDRPHGWQDEDDGHEQSPQHCPCIDEDTRFTHVPWARLKLAKDHFTDDRDAIAPVEGDGGDIEDTGNGGVGAETDEVDGDAEEDGDPDGIEGSAGQGVDLCPNAGEGDEAVAGEGKEGTCLGLLLQRD